MSGALESEFLQSIAPRNRIQQVYRVLVLVLLEACIFFGGGGLGVAALRLLFLQRNWSAKCPEILETMQANGCPHWPRSARRLRPESWYSPQPLEFRTRHISSPSVLQCEKKNKQKNPKKHPPLNARAAATRVYVSSDD